MNRKWTWFDYLDCIFILLITFICFYPIWYVFVISISTPKGYYADAYHLIPKTFSLESYKYIILDKIVFKAFGASLKVTTIGTIISVILTSFAGYVFSKSHLPGIKIAFKLALITMYFSGGMVPMYLLVTNLNLKNTIWSLILPSVIGTYNVILARNYFLSLPASLEESAKIDGATEVVILYKIIVPLSKPILATLTLFYAVGYWNSYINAMLYLSDSRTFTLPLVIRTLLTSAQDGNMAQVDVAAKTFTEGMNMAAIFISMLPIIIIYPYLQKYFVKGIMIGAVKE